MKKGLSKTLLSVIAVLMAVLAFFTFARFSVGINRYNSILGAIDTDYDLSGGTAYTLTLAEDNLEDVENVDEVLNTLKTRLTALGYQTFSVKALSDADLDEHADYDIRIELRGNVNEYGEVDTSVLASDVAVAAAYGEIKFYGGTSSSPTEEILTDGKAVKSAAYKGVYATVSGSAYRVDINFSDYGYDTIMELMGDSSYYLKITLGDTVLMSGDGAISKASFDGRSLSISTSTETYARQAALQIESGGLAYKYDISEGEAISSPYGDNIATVSVIAILAIAVLFIAYAFVKYHGFGLAYAFSTVLFVLLYIAMLVAVPGVKVAIGGVFGIIVALILTVFGTEKVGAIIKAEYAKGKTVRSAVKAGFKGALTPTLVSCAAALVTALLILAFATGTLKSFAVTLAIGSVLSAVTTLILHRMFSSLLLSATGYKEGFINLERTNDVSAETEE